MKDIVRTVIILPNERGLMMKKILIFVISLILMSLTFAGCSNANKDKEKTGNDDVIEIKLATIQAKGQSVCDAIEEKFIPLVEEKSNGTMKVILYSDGALGNEQQILTSLKNGSIEMTINGAGNELSLEALTLPFLFPKFEDAKAVLDDPVLKDIGADFETNNNLRILAAGASGFRVFSSKTPIRSIDDFVGLKLRMAEGYPVGIKTAEALKTNIVPLPASEIYISLETGVVDAQENPIGTILGQKIHEVQDYIYMSHHSFSPQMVNINNDFWRSLTEDQKDIIQTSIDEAMDYQWELMVAEEEEGLEVIRDAGLEVVYPEESDKEQLFDLMAPVYDWYNTENPKGKEIVDKMLGVINK